MSDAHFYMLATLLLTGFAIGATIDLVRVFRAYRRAKAGLDY
jgi:hypothetical protein